MPAPARARACVRACGGGGGGAHGLANADPPVSRDTGPADGGGGGVKITINLGSNAADARTIDVAQPLPPTPYLDYDDAHDTATDVAEFVP
jgi:hypothetical protein